MFFVNTLSAAVALSVLLGPQLTSAFRVAKEDEIISKFRDSDIGQLLLLAGVGGRDLQPGADILTNFGIGGLVKRFVDMLGSMPGARRPLWR